MSHTRTLRRHELQAVAEAEKAKEQAAEAKAMLEDYMWTPPQGSSLRGCRPRFF